MQLFFTPEIFEQLVYQTNLYHKYLKDTSDKPLPPFKEITVPEIKAFFGLLVAMGLAKLPGHDNYWGKGILQMPWFASVMPRDRFRAILQYFHLVDNRTSDEKEHPNHTKLFKLGGLDIKLSKSFSKMFYPGRNLSIDEQMIGTKC